MSEAEGAHPSPHQLAAFDAGTLPPAAHSEVERHVAGCADCCRTLDTLPEDEFVRKVRTLAGPPPAGGVPPADVPSELADHPRYRVLELLGVGGMGVVYRAAHRLMDRVVALKVIHRRLADRPAFVEHFRREVQAIARLEHPNIVTAHDADRAGDVHFLVMEYVEGITLDRLVARDGPLPVARACEVVRQAALGLQHAHERGLVHRDVKPGNVLVTPAGAVKVLDFGLAQFAAEAPAEAPSGSAPLVGTPDYVAPEQARDPADADARCDVYGLGGTLYFLLTGQPPFPGGTVLQKLLAHQDDTPRPVAELRPDVPPALAALLDRMLAKDPGRRPPTAAAVAEDLLRLTPPAPAPALRRGRRALLLLSAVPLAAVAAVSAALYLAHRDVRPSGGPTDPAPVSPPPAPTVPAAALTDLVSPEQAARERGEMRDRAVEWLRANCRAGPTADPVTDTAVGIERDLAHSEGFQVAVGARLLKSGKPTLLVARTRTWHVFELAGEQARDFPAREGHLRLASWSTSPDLRRAVPRVLLSDAAFDGADGLIPVRPVTGSVRYRVADRWSGESSLRLTCYLGRRRRCVLIPRFRLPEADAGTIPFAFPPIGDPGEVAPGPLVLFVEVTTRDGGKIVVESSAAVAVVRMAPGDAKKP